MSDWSRDLAEIQRRVDAAKALLSEFGNVVIIAVEFQLTDGRWGTHVSTSGSPCGLDGLAAVVVGRIDEGATQSIDAGDDDESEDFA